MNKKIITIVALLAVLAAAVAFRPQEKTPPSVNPEEPAGEAPTAVVEPGESAPSLPSPSRTPQETFQAYRDAAQASDREAIAAVSWKVSDACASELTAECADRIRAVVTATENMEAGQLTVVIADDKQAILATPVRFFETPDAYFAEQKVAYLARKDGTWRVAGIDPGRLWSVPRTSVMPPEEAKKRLEADILDTDRDGVTDRMERCDLPPTMQWMPCTQTDPEKRDSTGDGWWDGIRQFVIR
jgi:hypothetical protein